MLTMVCGLGRCGTSMVMQMLAAGGAPVVGQAPAYEPAEAGRAPIDATWLRSLGDGTVKILDPHRAWRGQCQARAIWIDRNENEQARSQVKFAAVVGGLPVRAGDWKRVRAILRRDRAAALRQLGGMERRMMRFEMILAAPMDAAKELAGWFPSFDQVAAAAAVRRRSAQCAPGMELEIALLTERGAKQVRR